MAAVNQGSLDVDWLLHSKKGMFTPMLSTPYTAHVTFVTNCLLARFTPWMHMFHSMQCANISLRAPPACREEARPTASISNSYFAED